MRDLHEKSRLDDRTRRGGVQVDIGETVPLKRAHVNGQHVRLSGSTLDPIPVKPEIKS
jgi:hypothetical protein